MRIQYNTGIKIYTFATLECSACALESSKETAELAPVVVRAKFRTTKEFDACSIVLRSLHQPHSKINKGRNPPLR